MGNRHPADSPPTRIALPDGLALPLEVRVHGRGGQGGVTCAKLIAALYTQMGLYVQTFGDYGSERSGAPVQAYARVDRAPISNRNKVYEPDHLIVLDEGLMGVPVLQGVANGALLLLNTHNDLDRYNGRFEHYRLGVVDATAIAREQGIGSAAVVIINTTILGAYARLLGVPLTALEHVFASLGLGSDLVAAEHAYGQVRIREASVDGEAVAARPAVVAAAPSVAPIVAHDKDIPAALKTGSWSNQVPVYSEHSAPCNLACPAGNDVVGFVQTLKNGGAEEAAEILLHTQPLPSVCGRVCPAPCMQSCNRAAFDGAVNIRSLERWIGDHAEFALPSHRVVEPLRVAVVGGGPAGISAAYQMALHGHAVTIYEAGPALGGVLRNGIPAFRLPKEALQRDLDRLHRLGIKTHCNARLGKEDLRYLKRDNDAVIVCIGLGSAIGLKVPGEKLRGIEQGLDFLDQVKQGPVPLHGTVLVVGGGNTAIDCARTALRCGAETVRILYRRDRHDMPAIAEEIAEAEREGVEFAFRSQPVEFAGDGSVSAAIVAEVEPGPADASGRRRPMVTSRTSKVHCDAVLLALGQSSGLGILPEGWSIHGGRAFEGEEILPVWFAGDCATGEGTVTHAIGSGRRVALDVLAKRKLLAPMEEPPVKRVAPGQIRFSHFDVASPFHDGVRLPPHLAGNFTEVNLGLEGPEEAERCFSCGHCTQCDTCIISCPEGVILRNGDGYRIETEYCKGCGMCVAECPRSAMEMQEKNMVSP